MQLPKKIIIILVMHAPKFFFSCVIYGDSKCSKNCGIFMIENVEARKGFSVPQSAIKVVRLIIILVSIRVCSVLRHFHTS